MGFAENLLLFAAVKEFGKSIKTWKSYSHGYGGTLFDSRCMRNMPHREAWCYSSVIVIQSMCYLFQSSHHYVDDYFSVGKFKYLNNLSLYRQCLHSCTSSLLNFLHFLNLILLIRRPSGISIFQMRPSRRFI